MRSVAQTAAYRAYSPRPFAKADRSKVEILFGGLHWRADRVIAAVFENLGYRARPLPPATRGDLLTGRELADIRYRETIQTPQVLAPTQGGELFLINER